MYLCYGYKNSPDVIRYKTRIAFLFIRIPFTYVTFFIFQAAETGTQKTTTGTTMRKYTRPDWDVDPMKCEDKSTKQTSSWQTINDSICNLIKIEFAIVI